MKELSEEYPTILDKQLPCGNVFVSDEIIHNDVSIR